MSSWLRAWGSACQSHHAHTSKPQAMLRTLTPTFLKPETLHHTVFVEIVVPSVIMFVLLRAMYTQNPELLHSQPETLLPLRHKAGVLRQETSCMLNGAARSASVGMFASVYMPCQIAQTIV